MAAAVSSLAPPRPAPPSLLDDLAAIFARGSTYVRRDPALWPLLRRQAELMRLPCVRAEDAELVCDLGLANGMAITLLDDVIDVAGDLARYDALADRYDAALFGPAGAAPVATADPIAIALDGLAAVLRAHLEALPRYAELADLLRFDLAQSLAAMRYDALFRRYRLHSAVEYVDTFHDHSMTVLWIKTLELCASPGFARADLSALRDAARLAQRAISFSGDAASWPTEVAAGERHPGVITHAIARGLLSWADLDACDGEPVAVTAAIHDSGVVAAIERDIAACLAALPAACARVASVDLSGWTAQVRALIAAQQAIRGRL